jgi:hypothetical protein
MGAVRAVRTDTVHEHVGKDRGTIVKEETHQGDPCLSLHTTLVWHIAVHKLQGYGSCSQGGSVPQPQYCGIRKGTINFNPPDSETWRWMFSMLFLAMGEEPVQ